MKISLRFKILGSFALIVILALAAAVGTGSRLTRSRYDDFAYQQDVGRAETLSSILGEWTAEAGVSETLPSLPSSVSPFFQGMMSRKVGFGRIVVTDLSGRVLLNTSGYDGVKLDKNNHERITIKNDEKDVGYLYVGRMIPEFHHPAEVSFLRTARLMTWLITAVIFVFAMALGLLLTRHITAPVKTLNAAARKVEGGDLSIRVPDTRTDELGDLSRGFNSMIRFLDSADKQRRRLIADSAHELRTPVSLIRARIEMMEEGIYPMDRESLSALSAESVRLSRLVDELKTLADLESPELELSKENINLSEIIQEVVEAAKPAILRRNINVETEINTALVLNGDRGKIQGLLSNLLSNALRYADSGISIRADYMKGKPDWLEILVEDDGSGIPEEDRAKVFERYYRVDASRTRSSGGSGLGLAICGEIVRAHGGSIEAGESDKMGGAGLVVNLPTGLSYLHEQF